MRVWCGLWCGLWCVCVLAVVVGGCPTAQVDQTNPSPPSSPSSALPEPTAPATVPPPPTPEEAIVVVEQFYAQYRDALTPALMAMFSAAQRARATSHAAQCAAVSKQIAAGKDLELPSACESDPYLCAQDRVPMAKAKWQAPGTVVVAFADTPEFGVRVMVTPVDGAWTIDGFRCFGG
jgi:hypothetical protein